MAAVLKDKGRPLASFHKGDVIEVSNNMRKGYSYELAEEPGKNFAQGFEPFSTPGEILALGAFGGRYLNDCLLEFPAEWFWRAGLLGKLAPGAPPMGDVSLNYFKIDSRLPLGEWQKAGWVPPSKGEGQRPEGKKLTGGRAVLSDPERNPDERGWFQWYCRYYLGRRIHELDEVQQKRWRAFTRHAGAIKKNCRSHNLTCRPRQRQALLQWAYRPTI